MTMHVPVRFGPGSLASPQHIVWCSHLTRTVLKKQTLNAMFTFKLSHVMTAPLKYPWSGLVVHIRGATSKCIGTVVYSATQSAAIVIMLRSRVFDVAIFGHNPGVQTCFFFFLFFFVVNVFRYEAKVADVCSSSPNYLIL